MASATSLRLDQRVSIPGKGFGTIAFIGKTEFADGDWIGVILDEPKGKNNGTVQKKDGTTVRYFSCNDNHGLYVRPTQIESIVNEIPTNLPRSTSVQSVKSQIPSPASTSAASSTSSSSVVPTTKPSSTPAKPTVIRTPSGRSAGFDSDDSSDWTGPARTSQSSHDLPSVTPKEDIKPVVPAPPPPPVAPAPIEQLPTTPVEPKPPVEAVVSPVRKVASPSSDSVESQQLIASLKTKITDQEEQIQTLIKKRRDDLEKLKEYDRTKLQLDQLQSYKREAQERIKDLNDKLSMTENELNDTRDKFVAYRDEMNDTEIRLESLTLDLEMAEEKLETVTAENAQLKEKLEEVQLELDVIKGEIQLNGTAQVANGIQKRVDDERIMKMEQALIKLRDLSLSKQAENDALKKQNEALEHRLKVMSKENDHLKENMSTVQSTITDLKEQVDTCLGAQQMVDILTTKNLALEDQVRELQETVENLESLYEVDKEMEENAREVEHDLRQTIDLLQNQLHEKDRQIEKLQYSIADHERTILKFRETLKQMQNQNELNQKQAEKYLEQLKLAGSVQSSEFKAKILDTKSYAEHIDAELKKMEVMNLARHVQLLSLFLPEQWSKRGGDYDCLLLVLLIQRFISKCDLLMNEIEKKFEKIEQVTIDDVIKSHRAEEWSFACKVSQSICTFRMNLRKYLKILEICSPEALRRVAHAFPDLINHEKALNFLIDLLQKDQLHDSVALTALDKTILFYEHVFKSYLIEEKFNMSTYLQDLARVVLFSSDALQTDIQRLQILQKAYGQPGHDQSAFTRLIQRLIESNGQMRSHAVKISRLISQEEQSQRCLIIDSTTLSSIDTIIRHLERLAKTFDDICSGLTTQILMLTDANDRISVQDIENIAYQACDKVYKKEDRGPYESLWDSMHETVAVLSHISESLETGAYDSTVLEQNERVIAGKQPIHYIAEKLRMSIHELETLRGRLELKEEESIDLKKLLKAKQDDLGELQIRLSMSEKRMDSAQREIDEKTHRYKQSLEEMRVDSQKKIKQLEDAITVLQNDNEQLEQEKSLLKERLKQISKMNPMDALLQKKLGTTQRTNLSSDITGSPQRPISSSNSNEGILTMMSNDQEIASLRNTIRLLKEELWHLKMNQTSNELSKLQLPSRDAKTSQIADIYKSSNLLLNDLFSTIANYKITGENVTAKQELIRSKMKVINQTASTLNNRLHECQSAVLPGSTVPTVMKTFPHSQFSKPFTQERQLVAEIQFPGVQRNATTAELEINDEQYRTIMREAIGCI